MKSFFKALGIIVVIGLILLIGNSFTPKKNQTPAANEPVTVTPESTKITSPSSKPAAKTEIPGSYLIKSFPFQSQAPLGNWDELHDEACEEASVILVNWWRERKSSISQETMNQEILKMVDWEIKNFGSHKDLTALEVVKMAKSYYGIGLKQENNISILDIKKAIAAGHPVIVPTAGRLLGNPYFRSPGPIYHMLVIIGYQGDNFIVQDVGTRRGDHYKYNQNTLYNAIHDWNGSDESINQGKKTMLVY